MIDIVVYILLFTVLLLNALIMSPFVPLVSKERRREIVFSIAYSLVWEAERVWNGYGEHSEYKLGHIKKAMVKAKLYVIVSAMTLFRYSILDKKFIDEVIEEAYIAMETFKHEGK